MHTQHIYAYPAHLCKLVQAPRYLFQPQSIHQPEQVTVYDRGYELQFALDSHSEVVRLTSSSGPYRIISEMEAGYLAY